MLILTISNTENNTELAMFMIILAILLYVYAYTHILLNSRELSLIGVNNRNNKELQTFEAKKKD